MERFALGGCVANLEDTVIGQSDDIAGPCFLDGALALSHKLGGGGETQALALPHVEVGLVAHEPSGAHLAEGDARAVVWVDVGRYLEDEAGELGLFGLHHALLRLGGTGARGNLHKTVEQFLHTEVVER